MPLPVAFKPISSQAASCEYTVIFGHNNYFWCLLRATLDQSSQSKTSKPAHEFFCSKTDFRPVQSIPTCRDTSSWSSTKKNSELVFDRTDQWNIVTTGSGQTNEPWISLLIYLKAQAVSWSSSLKLPISILRY